MSLWEKAKEKTRLAPCKTCGGEAHCILENEWISFIIFWQTKTTVELRCCGIAVAARGRTAFKTFAHARELWVKMQERT